jgi:hypothetical protein
MAFSCFKCGKRIEYPSGSRVLRGDTCPLCGSNLHCCLNCCFYDPAKHNQCAETQAEWVRDKESANFCNYFWPNPILMAQGGSVDAKAKFNGLFDERRKT